MRAVDTNVLVRLITQKQRGSSTPHTNSDMRQDADVVAGALDRYRRKPQLGFSDCLVLEIAMKAGHIPLGTFDKNLSKLEGTEGL